MEGLNHKWTKSRATGLYHYFVTDRYNYDEVKNSLCRKFKVSLCYERPREYVDEYEILDTSQICGSCQRLLGISKHNKKILDEIILNVNDDEYVLTNVACDEPGCNVKGVAFVSSTKEKKPHYCIDHNVLVKYTLEKESLA